MTIYELRWAAGGHIAETVRFFRPEQSPDHLVRFSEVVVMMDRDPSISAAWAHLKQIDGSDETFIAGWTKCSDERPTAVGFDSIEAVQAHTPGRQIVQPGELTSLDRTFTEAGYWRTLGAVVGGEIGKLRGALARLASGNAFDVPRVASEEERQRIVFAQAELDASRERYPAPAILIDMEAARETQLELYREETTKLEKQVEGLRKMLVERTIDIIRTRPDPTIRRISPQALELLAGEAEAAQALAEDEDERLSATALEMLVMWQREAMAGDPEFHALRKDAERWRALLTIPEIKMQGSAGVNPHTGERTGGAVHFGAEFWTDMDIAKYPDLTEGRERSTAWGRNCLIATADRLLENMKERADAAQA